MKYAALMFVGLLSCGQVALADAVDPQVPSSTVETFLPTSAEVQEVKDAWAEAKYNLKGDEQIEAFETLITRIDTLREQGGDPAEWDLWEGTVLSTYASLKGGMGALKMVTRARDLLEKSLEQAPHLEDSLAYGVLGTLYYRVPKWPVGFKDGKKAKRYLQKAVASAPESIDANFYYGEYLASQKEYKEAQTYFSLAMQAPHRPDRELSDMGRRHEIQQALDALNKRLG